MELVWHYLSLVDHIDCKQVKDGIDTLLRQYAATMVEKEHNKGKQNIALWWPHFSRQWRNVYLYPLSHPFTWGASAKWQNIPQEKKLKGNMSQMEW